MRALPALASAASLPLLLVLGVVLGVGESACTPPVGPKDTPTSGAPSTSASASTGDSLEITDLAEGSGPAVRKGSAISVEYTGTLVDGTVFDSSKSAGKAFTFVVGNGNVIRGWDLGVIGMKKGGTRKLVIPPRLGYGAAGSPPKIPGDATLIFEIELVHLVE